MGHQRNTISNQEHEERSRKLLKDYNYTQADLKELYFLYNDKFEPRKTDWGCGTCVAYVFKRLKDHYAQT